MDRKNRSDVETTPLTAASVVVDRPPSSELITFAEAIPVPEGDDRSLALENEARLINIPICFRPNPRNSQLVVCKSCTHRGYTRTKTFHNSIMFVNDTFKYTEHYCSNCNDLTEVVPPWHDCCVKYGGPGSEQPNNKSHEMIEKNNIREGNVASV